MIFANLLERSLRMRNVPTMRNDDENSPHWLFAHLFDENGKLLPATPQKKQPVREESL